MSFWDSDLGEITGNATDAFAKTFKQIPDGTMALAKIESFVNAEYNGNKYLTISWMLVEGDFKGSKVEQKLKVYGDPMSLDSSKVRHRALNMLKLIYQLFNIKLKHAGEPTDQDLLAFVGKIAGIKIRETEPNEKGRQYNWVAEIHDTKDFKCETGSGLVIAHTHTNNHSSFGDLSSAFSRKDTVAAAEDDVPF